MPETQGYTQLKNGAARLAWPHLRELTISGSDATDWLQGQVSQDLNLLAEASNVRSCLLKSSGQILEVLSVSKTQDGLRILVEGGAKLLDRFRDFVILEDVEVQDLGPVPWLVFGPNAGSLLESSVDDVSEAGFVTFQLGALTGLAVTKDSSVTAERLIAAIPVQATMDDVSVATLEQESPVAFWDADEKTLPPELGPQFDRDHVSYTKGCYVGQEVVQRIHSRGHTNRVWRVLRLSENVDVGSEVASQTGERAGRVTRTSLSPTMGWLAGAMMLKKSLGGTQGFKIGTASADLLQA